MQLDQDSFNLLRRLYEAEFNPVPFDLLKQHIWSDDFQPDYSLKRLARELQQQLIKAEIDQIQVVDVEGVGYALKAKTSSRMFFLAAFVAMAIIMYLFINVISPMVRSTSMVNNRIVLLTQELPRDSSNLVYYQAVDQMRINLTASDILLMISHSTNDSAREMMDKYNNAGLVIEWFKVEQIIRIDIYEPITQNLLTSTSLSMTDFNELDKEIESLVIRIERLITSELLPLNEVQLTDPYNPVWDKMRTLLEDTKREVK